ncbi:MD2BP protein, partial [Alcedo cyanopectus]|nr:MD2BP protein [Ceyx cyanopectus]
VSVVFPGAVSRDCCCRFVCELLKHVLYQRQQLPLPYEQFAYFSRRAAQVRGLWQCGGVWGRLWAQGQPCRRCCGSLAQQLACLACQFSLHAFLRDPPDPPALLSGNDIYGLEHLVAQLGVPCPGSDEESLKTASCVRKLFHSLFVADVFSELETLPAMGTVVMLQGHRDCGVDWFRPKLNYKAPARGKKLIVNLSSEGDINISASPPQHGASTWENYVWFQTPVTLKGFHD